MGFWGLFPTLLLVLLSIMHQGGPINPRPPLREERRQPNVRQVREAPRQPAELADAQMEEFVQGERREVRRQLDGRTN